jgi:hypothetical protein
MPSDAAFSLPVNTFTTKYLIFHDSLRFSADNELKLPHLAYPGHLFVIDVHHGLTTALWQPRL